jgi:hypothetical protein
MYKKLSDRLHTKDLAKILYISPEAARKKIRTVKEEIGYDTISVGEYIEYSKCSPTIFGF